MRGEAEIRALVFDFDSLSLNAEAAEQQAWRETYLAHGTLFPEEEWLGNESPAEPESDLCRQLERQLGGRVNQERVLGEVAHRKSELLASETPPSGMIDFIERAAEIGMQLGIASDGQRQAVSAWLARLGLGKYFSAVRCAADLSETQAGPRIYFSLCEAMNVAPTESIAIQSSPGGLQSAKGAGLYCIAVPNRVTGSVSMDRADLVLLSLENTTPDEVIERARLKRAATP
ncbi:MAG: HAD hydrolase-like protein [Myxococcota bacterium]|nr:HAD hydrolase-like protein [Myxococcota bacterium]